MNSNDTGKANCEGKGESIAQVLLDEGCDFVYIHVYEGTQDYGSIQEEEAAGKGECRKTIIGIGFCSILFFAA